MSAWSGQSRRHLPSASLQRLLAGVTLLIGSAGASAAQVVINGPPGSGRFGGSTTVLPNGNIVVTDPAFDIPSATDVGAVYLYGPGGTLISMIRGSRRNDLLGGYGVVVLGSGNFVVLCPSCDHGNVQDAGAVVFGSAKSGVHGVVSPANALVGSNTLDRIGSGLIFDFKPVYSLSNGNYVVVAPYWNGSRGATIFGSGHTGISGIVSPNNSLVGSQSGDQVGSSGVIALSNGNYLVRSPSWNNGDIQRAGAVTFGSGTTGIVGAVSPENSLVGSSYQDGVGGDINDASVVGLKNGNYVVVTPAWDRGEIVNAGAVTFGSGITGVSGTISALNSLVGSQAGDRLGGAFGGIGITTLRGGNYVIRSWFWNQGAGAVTHGSGTIGIIGEITDSNSLLGATASSVTELAGNAYVIASPGWNENRGAVTLASARGGVVGSISAINSLVGDASGQLVGSGGVVALTNGNFVISSPGWDLDQTPDVGATTFIPISTPITGTLSPSNSLIGTRTGDHQASTIVPLSNGNYVVANPHWDHGALIDAGAVTFASGTRGISGIIGLENSLVGASAGDRVGSAVNVPSGITPLANGNYVVSSPAWNRGAIVDAGAATFASGRIGVTGTISTANSLVGSQAGDAVGRRVVALTTGNYVVGSRSWDQGPIVDAGAVTFGSGTHGISGTVSSANSLIGSSTRDELGDGDTPLALPNGFYLVRSSYWDNAGTVDAGAITLGTPDGRVFGPVTEDNSALGILAGQGIAQIFAYDSERNQLVVGQPASNRVVLHRSGLATQIVIVGNSPNPSEPGQSVTFTARVTGFPSAPADGHVRFLASTGESCMDSSGMALSVTEVEYSCSIVFATTNESRVVAEYLGSINHAYSGPAAVMQFVGIYANGFEGP